MKVVDYKFYRVFIEKIGRVLRKYFLCVEVGERVIDIGIFIGSFFFYFFYRIKF